MERENILLGLKLEIINSLQDFVMTMVKDFEDKGAGDTAAEFIAEGLLFWTHANIKSISEKLADSQEARTELVGFIYQAFYRARDMLGLPYEFDD